VPEPKSGGAAGAMPDMTFRLERKEIERIMGTSARGSAAQIVQVAPAGQKFTQVMDKNYVTFGKAEHATIKVSGFMCPGVVAVLIKGDHGYRCLALSRKFKVNDRHIDDSPLVDGDLLQFGNRRYRFCMA
jgi:hypothetical protein